METVYRIDELRAALDAGAPGGPLIAHRLFIVSAPRGALAHSPMSDTCPATRRLRKRQSLDAHAPHALTVAEVVAKPWKLSGAAIRSCEECSGQRDIAEAFGYAEHPIRAHTRLNTQVIQPLTYLEHEVSQAKHEHIAWWRLGNVRSSLLPACTPTGHPSVPAYLTELRDIDQPLAKWYADQVADLTARVLAVTESFRQLTDDRRTDEPRDRLVAVSPAPTKPWTMLSDWPTTRTISVLDPVGWIRIADVPRPVFAVPASSPARSSRDISDLGQLTASHEVDLQATLDVTGQLLADAGPGTPLADPETAFTTACGIAA